MLHFCRKYKCRNIVSSDSTERKNKVQFQFIDPTGLHRTNFHSPSHPASFVLANTALRNLDTAVKYRRVERITFRRTFGRTRANGARLGKQERKRREVWTVRFSVLCNGVRSVASKVKRTTPIIQACCTPRRRAAALLPLPKVRPASFPWNARFRRARSVV